MTDLASVQATVYGIVQGVFFRAFVQRQATRLGLSGYVRNLPAGDAVEVHAEGEKKQLNSAIRLIESIKGEKPLRSKKARCMNCYPTTPSMPQAIDEKAEMRQSKHCRYQGISEKEFSHYGSN